MLLNQISLDRNSPESLQKQIRRQIAQAIVNHRIGANQKLPSIRAMSRTLGVSTTTVILAYELLQVDGFIQSRRRSGFFIDADAVSPMLRTTGQPRQHDTERFDFSSILGNRVPKMSFTARHPDSLKRYDYPFLWGLIDPKLFPVAQWRQCTLDAASTLELRSWSADYSDQDDPLLVQQLIDTVLPMRGIYARPEEILITTGSQNAAYLAIKCLLEPGERMGIENPGYAEAVNMARLEGVSLHPLRYDARGIHYDPGAAACKCLYVTPSHQVPTNRTMSLEARTALLRAATENGQMIIEDDYGCDVVFRRELPPSICSLGKAGNVIYIGTPSDTLNSGLRIGYMVADHEVIRRARDLRRLILRHPPINNQRSLAIFIQRGYLMRLYTTLNKAFRQRAQIALDAIDEFFPTLPQVPFKGGTSLWMQLPVGIDGDDFRADLLKQGIFVENGQDFFLEPQDRPAHILIGLMAIDEAKIRPGFQKIGAIMQAMM